MAEVRRTIPSRPVSIAHLKGPLDRLLSEYDQKYLNSDPLRFPHRFLAREDQEVVAFLAALFAFGSVAAISRSMEQILEALGEKPYAAVLRWPDSPIQVLLRFRHRWISSQDLHTLLLTLRNLLHRFGSLERLFQSGQGSDVGFSRSIGLFCASLREEAASITKGHDLTRGLQFLISAPEKGGALKRMNLFFRWVVRRASPDLGLWRIVGEKDLLLPLDTHVSRFVRYLGLTNRKTAGWRMVIETTERLQELDPTDPVKYDFALARLGILGRCKHRPDPRCCPVCPLVDVCLLNSNRYRQRAPALTPMTQQANSI